MLTLDRAFDRIGLAFRDQAVALRAAPPPGWRIDHLVTKPASDHSYQDSNTTEDSFELGSAEPVRRLVFVGDARGDEAGTQTRVTVYLNQILVVLTQDSHCVGDSAIRFVRAAGMLSKGSIARLEAPTLQQISQRTAALKGMRVEVGIRR